MRRYVLFALVLPFIVIETVIAQTPSPTPAAAESAAAVMERLEDQKKLIEKETELLEARRKYLEAFRAAPGQLTVTRENAGGKTEFGAEPAPISETVSLSYDAVREISREIDTKLGGLFGGYERLVFYSEKDFNALPRYRLYREHLRHVLASYDALIKQLNEEATRVNEKQVRIQSVDRSPAETFISALAMPSIAGSAVRSAAELISLFRTDRTITQSSGVVDERSLDTVLAGTLMQAHPNLRIYNPEQFVPDYNVGIGDRNSIYEEIVRAAEAEAFLDYFLSEMARQGVEKRLAPAAARLVDGARIVKNQLHGVALTIRAGAAASEQGDMSEFKLMVRAEKLDRFLRSTNGTNNRAGVMLVRMLRSGGSRRESRNLILGTKTDYSGSAFVEVAVYDADGTLRASDVFSYHTGFRKFPTRKE